MLDIDSKRRTPHVRQSEASECALACLAMVSRYHGLNVDMPSLRQRFPISLKGATLTQIIAILDELGFSARPLKLDPNEILHLKLPAILHWDLNHFVVINKIQSRFGKTIYSILDPARDPSKLSYTELSRHFTGVAVEVSKSERFDSRPNLPKLSIKHLWSSIDGLWLTLGQTFILSCVLQLISLVSPLYLQTALDIALPSSDADLLIVLALGFSGVAILNVLTTWTRSIILTNLNNSISYHIVANLFRHLMRLPFYWFEKRHVGDVISRFGSIKPVTDLVSQGLIASLVDGIMAITTLAIMFMYSPLLAMIAVAAVLIYILLRLAFFQTLRIKNVSVIAANAHENSIFIESVRGISAIKAFGQEAGRLRLWQRAKAEAVNAQIRLSRISIAFDAINQLLLAFERIAFIYFAIRMALKGSISTGMIFAFQAYRQQFLDATLRLVEQALNLNIVQMHLGRVADIAFTREEPSQPQLRSIASLRKPSASIELRNIHFSYGAGEVAILKGINLRVDAGEKVALVGPSGGGKTTLLKIMMGLLQPTFGEVLIDGVPLRTYGVARWRSEIGSTAQDDILFAGSIADNISFFDPASDRVRVERAAISAAIHDDIEKLPMKYESLVGDMGAALSGGQKQRILLARALYVDPRALFIDEGTSHLDPSNEARVVGALAQMPITQVSVAHRGNVATAAHRVLLVAGGGVSEVSKRSDPGGVR